MISHLIKQSIKYKPLHLLLSTLLDEPSSTTTTTTTPPTPKIGLLISERLINMPVQTQPPLYRMLGEEIAAASAKVSFSPPFPLPSLRSSFPLLFLYDSETDPPLLFFVRFIIRATTPTPSPTTSSSRNSTSLLRSRSSRATRRRRTRKRRPTKPRLPKLLERMICRWMERMRCC